MSRIASTMASSSEEELSIPEEEEDLKDTIGLYIGERNPVGDRHGRGWAILPNGDQYDGQYRQGRRHGFGLYVFKGGVRYYGKYRCGHRSGRGIFIYPDGSVYEGNWRKGMKHGKGRYFYTNGDTYTGDWNKGFRHGVGIYSFKSDGYGQLPIRFKGTWHNGMRVGPCEVYIGVEDKVTVLHGNWDTEFPLGPAVFSFNQKNMLMGYFQAPPRSKEYMSSKPYEPSEFEGMEDDNEKNAETLILSIIGTNRIGSSQWFAQNICAYDYSELPQEPVPLPVSDSDVSVCSLSTAPTEIKLTTYPRYATEGEAEEGEMECTPEGECSMNDIESSSDVPCAPSAKPCAIEIMDNPC